MVDGWHGCPCPAAGEEGLLTVTDDDVIEKSNLSRQFLFRYEVQRTACSTG